MKVNEYKVCRRAMLLVNENESGSFGGGSQEFPQTLQVKKVVH